MRSTPPLARAATTRPAVSAGGQIGYRWQAANWVFGVEAQGDWADLTGSNASQTVLIPATNQTKIDAIGLFTGQVGYAWNNVLWYVKGGAAVTDNKYSTFFTATGVEYNRTSEARWGGAVGTGIEIGFAPNWSVAVEYDHLFMGTRNVTFPATAHCRLARRRHPSERRHGNDARQLSLGRPGHREVLSFAFSKRNTEKAGLAPAFLLAGGSGFWPSL